MSGDEVRVLVRIKALKLKAEAKLARYAHTGPFGDLAADLYASEGVVIEAGVTLAVSTGVALEFPATHGALVEDRSGLAVRGLTTLAGGGDPGDRGEVKGGGADLRPGAGGGEGGGRGGAVWGLQRVWGEIVGGGGVGRG